MKFLNKIFKPGETKEELSAEERIERAASILGVSPSSLEKKLNGEPTFSQAQAAKKLGLSPRTVGVARQIEYTSPHQYALRKLGIREEELAEWKEFQLLSDKDKVEKIVGKNSDSLTKFLALVYATYKDEKKIHKNSWKYLPYESHLSEAQEFLTKAFDEENTRNASNAAAYGLLRIYYALYNLLHKPKKVDEKGRERIVRD